MSFARQLLSCLIALVFCGAAQATWPLLDLVEFEGEAREVHWQPDLPEQDWEKSRLWLKKSRELAAAQSKLSYCSAGAYLVGRWRIAQGRLYLLHAFSCGQTFELASLYPGKTAPLFADWVDADIELHDGPLLCSILYLLEIHRTHIHLSIRQGKVIDIRRLDMRSDSRVPPGEAKDRSCLTRPS